MNTHRWYAVRTRSRAEKVVREQLTQRAVDCFLPMMTRLSQWKDRRKRIDWPLFPGYCFVNLSVQQRLVVLQTPGVIEIIGSAQGRSEPIPDHEIAAIQRVLLTGRPYDPHPHLEEGMAVEVIRGPLIGIQGRLIKKTDGCRLVLAINLIGQAAAVHMDAADVAPVQPRPAYELAEAQGH